MHRTICEIDNLLGMAYREIRVAAFVARVGGSCRVTLLQRGCHRCKADGSRPAAIVNVARVRSIPARELVRGDLIQVEAGDRIPADGRLVYAAVLQTQEASLTGESAPVAKSAEPLPA